MEPVLLLVASGPRTPEAATALALAAALQEAGHPVSLCLLQDATLLALARSDRPLPAQTRPRRRVSGDTTPTAQPPR